MEEAIFSHLEALQGEAPWGRLLDAGTGPHSLGWMASLPSTSWTAVTCGQTHARKLERQFARQRRDADRVVCGDWRDPTLLHGEVFDVVVADYLLGAVDRFAPYFQDELFDRLRRHVGDRLYVVALAPYPARASTPGGELILELTRLRDACILLAGDRCYREYPMEWTLRSLERSGYRIEDTRVFPILYGARFFEGQLDVCRRKLPHVADRQLAGQLERAVDELQERSRRLEETSRGIRFGEDYAVYARPSSP